jgi:hypothetical protein
MLRRCTTQGVLFRHFALQRHPTPRRCVTTEHVVAPHTAKGVVALCVADHRKPMNEPC